MTDTRTTPAPPLTLVEAVEAVDQFVAEARDVYRHGGVAHLTFSPGDGTPYTVTMIPPTLSAWATPGERCRVMPNQAVLALTTPTPASRAITIKPDGCPDAGYVSEHLGTDNSYTVLAVGLVWHLMVAEPFEPLEDRVARAASCFMHLPGRVGTEQVLAEWRRDMVTPRLSVVES